MASFKVTICIMTACILLSGCGRHSSSRIPEIWRKAPRRDVIAAETVALADAQRNLARALYAKKVIEGVDILSEDSYSEERITGTLRGQTSHSETYMDNGVVNTAIYVNEANAQGYGALPGNAGLLNMRLVAERDLERNAAGIIGKLKFSESQTFAERCKDDENLCVRLAILVSGAHMRISWGGSEVEVSADLQRTSSPYGKSSLPEELAKALKPFGGPDEDTLKRLNPGVEKIDAFKGSSKAKVEDVPDGYSKYSKYSISGLFGGSIAAFKGAIDRINGTTNTEMLK